MISPTVDIRLDHAEKMAGLLEGFGLLLRDSMPQRLVDKLDEYEDPYGVFDPLRYDLPIGPEYVADELDMLNNLLRSAISAAQTAPPKLPGTVGDSWRDAMAIVQLKLNASSSADRKMVIDAAMTDHHPGHMIDNLATLTSISLTMLGALTNQSGDELLRVLSERTQDRLDDDND